MLIELLCFEGCPGAVRLRACLPELLARHGIPDEVLIVRVETHEDAVARRFLGSPTLRIDGQDIDPSAATRDDFGLKCRLYTTPAGLRGTPPDDLLSKALTDAGR